MVAADNVTASGQHDRLGLVVGLLAAFLHRQRHERRAILEHQITHQLVGAFAYAQDVQKPPRLQLSHGLGTDHAAVGHDAHPRNIEAPA